jgi:SAM-dependent methyltransferase
MNQDGFIDIPFSIENIDRYIIRSSIKNAIVQNMHIFNGRLLDIGCGKMPYKTFLFKNSQIKEYTGLDIEGALDYEGGIQPDDTWNGITMPYDNEQYDTAFATEVLEHCPQPAIILKEVHRVLKPGGYFFFTVPFLWPLHEVPHDEFRYTPFSLNRLLTSAGFIDIDIKATGGWHASLAQMLGLWVRRSPLGKSKRRILSFFFKPVIKALLKKDKLSSIGFTESQMITGLTGIAFKK